MLNPIAKIYQSAKTVLSTRDAALILGKTNMLNLKSSLSYFVKTGSLIRLRRGVFATTKNYNRDELATSIFLPSYISLETVLAREGMIFQYYSSIFIISYLTREIEVDGQKIACFKIKNEVLYNPAGIDFSGSYPIASKERAFLDRIYLAPNYYFDSLRPLDWDKCFELAPIYKNKRVLKQLNSYYKDYVEQNKS